MNQLRKSKNILEILLVIGLILIIPLFFSIRTAANSQTVPNTAMPLPPTVVNALENSNALKPKQPPACTFPLAQTTTAESVPEKYVFSEPQVVITPEANDSIVEIVGWLPDSQRVLLIQNFADTIKQNIELFDTQTGNIQL